MKDKRKLGGHQRLVGNGVVYKILTGWVCTKSRRVMPPAKIGNLLPSAAFPVLRIYMFDDAPDKEDDRNPSVRARNQVWGLIDRIALCPESAALFSALDGWIAIVGSLSRDELRGGEESSHPGGVCSL